MGCWSVLLSLALLRLGDQHPLSGNVARSVRTTKFHSVLPANRHDVLRLIPNRRFAYKFLHARKKKHSRIIRSVRRSQAYGKHGGKSVRVKRSRAHEGTQDRLDNLDNESKKAGYRAHKGKRVKQRTHKGKRVKQRTHKGKRAKQRTRLKKRARTIGHATSKRDSRKKLLVRGHQRNVRAHTQRHRDGGSTRHTKNGSHRKFGMRDVVRVSDAKACECIPTGFRTRNGLTIDAPNTHVNYDYIMRKNKSTGMVHYYPSAYGSYCDAWDRSCDTECKTDYPPTHCSQRWCYVHPTCDAPDLKKSTFFPQKSTFKHLYVTYSQCNSFDAAAATRCHGYNDMECSSHRGCIWVADTEVCQDHKCMCTGNDSIDSDLFPSKDYGTSCAATWDQTSCSKHWEGLEHSLGLWCCKRWCYVSPQCPSAMRSTIADGLYYSYVSCPEHVDDLLNCPWKKPVDMLGQPLPLSKNASKELWKLERAALKENNIPRVDDRDAKTAAIAAVLTTLVLVGAIIFYTIWNL